MLSSKKHNIRFACNSFEPEEYAIDWGGVDPGGGTVLSSLYMFLILNVVRTSFEQITDRSLAKY